MKMFSSVSFRSVVLLAAGMFFAAHARGAPFFSCTFASSPTTECGFTEQSKVAGRAGIVGWGRDGLTSVRLHTEPGDNNVVFSGDMERDDLSLSPTYTEGAEQWWAHSILFPNDFVHPWWHPYVVFDFHNTGASPPSANFHVSFTLHCESHNPDINCDGGVPGDLIFLICFGNQDPATCQTTVIAPGGATEAITRNVWYDFVYHMKWSASAGYIDAWVRQGNEGAYRRVLAYRGPTLYPGQGVYLKLANYHVVPCDIPAPHTPYPQCLQQSGYYDPPSSVIHDRVIGGASWNDVALVVGPLEGQYEENAAIYQALTTWGPAQGTFSGGFAAANNVLNSTVVLPFTGKQVTWMGVKCNTCGTASVTIDGGNATSVDTYGPNGAGLTSEAVYDSGTLAPGLHYLVITNTSAAWVAVDGFWVTP
jgi:hypothetical protein